MTNLGQSKSATCHCADRPRPELVWHTREDGFQRAMQFGVGYNCDARGPRSHGVHGMELRFYLLGPRGATQFVMSTDWVPGKLSPGHGLPPLGSALSDRARRLYPMGMDLGYHAYKPQYDGQLKMPDCHLLDGDCFYDGSGLNADRVMNRFIEGGEPVIWQELIAYHEELTI